MCEQAPSVLQERFAYMFTGKSLSFEYYAGWMALLARACEQIDTVLGADRRQFQWTALDARGGTYRLLYRMTGDRNAHRIENDSITLFVELAPRPHDAVASAVADSVARARAVSARSCIVCGMFVASALNGLGSLGGRVASLCQAHEALATTWWRGAHNLHISIAGND